MSDPHSSDSIAHLPTLCCRGKMRHKAQVSLLSGLVVAFFLPVVVLLLCLLDCMVQPHTEHLNHHLKVSSSRFKQAAVSIVSCNTAALYRCFMSFCYTLAEELNTPILDTANTQVKGVVGFCCICLAAFSSGSLAPQIKEFSKDPSECFPQSPESRDGCCIFALFS